ncbi:urease accessory protein UreD [Litoreibacter albidus]|uniref:urease accessory protein UreD n=1 Tax=Litoreibacter albidus TaxID=670155 RepID=UPI003735BB79
MSATDRGSKLGIPQISIVAHIEVEDQTAVQPRARGAVAISVKATAQGTGLRNLRQSGSSKAIFPRSAARGLEAVLINTAGGMTGGDTFGTDVDADCDTELTLSTQAAERAYRAQPLEVARLSNRLKLRGTARVNWLPQETILFENSAFERTLHVEMDDASTLLMVEPLVFGRAAMGEVLRQCHFKDRVEIIQNDVPLYLDAVRLNGDAAAHLARAGVAGGAGAMANVLYVAPDAPSLLAALRPLLSDSFGASLIRDSVLCVRALAADSYALRQSLIPILRCLNTGYLPRSWML